MSFVWKMETEVMHKFAWYVLNDIFFSNTGPVRARACKAKREGTNQEEEQTHHF